VDPLLDAAPCGFLVVGDDGHVEAANATAARMLGTPDAALLVGRHVDYLLSIPSRIFFQTHIFPTLKLQGTVHEVYVSFIDAVGDELPVLLNAQRRQEGERTVSDWVIVPMRQRNELENELVKARRVAEANARAKEQFLGLVTHELRSPLGAIRNWAGILGQGNPDAAMIKRAAESIERNAQLQAKLIEDILDEVRIATGKLHLELEDIDATVVLNSVLDSAAGAARAKSIRLERDVSGEPLVVRADATRLQQILWNIVSNAIKFTDTGGRVHVRMHSENGWVEVVVNDTGRGITPEFLPQVFEHFKQEASGTRSGGGLGLGMAITRKLVELHGGSIFAASEGAGKGATFTVRLPALHHAGDEGMSTEAANGRVSGN
jgi:signal transduction histidine kinase